MTVREAKDILARPLRIVAFAILPVMIALAVTEGYRRYRWIRWKKEPFTVRKLKIGNSNLKVLTAVNPYQWHAGLSVFPDLPDSIDGMLFVFPKDDSVSFWTYGMRYPVSIYFLDGNLRIRGWVFCVEPCTRPPCSVYTGKARYVLEVRCGGANQRPLKTFSTRWRFPYRVVDFSLPENH